MTPAFSTLFNLLAKTVRVQDIFYYSGITFEAVYGNVTAKIGNTIFHTNVEYNSDADIVIGTNTFTDFDLPLNADRTVRETGYEFTYNVQIVDQLIGSSSVTTPGSATFSNITIPSNPTLIAAINALITAGTDVRIQFFPDTAGYPVLSTTGNTQINFASVTIAEFASISSMNILSTTLNTTVHNYDFCDITPEGELCVSSDCFFAQLTAQDNTVYPTSTTLLTRELKIQWPRLKNGNPVESPVITSDASKTIGPNIYSGNYTVTLSSEVTWTQTDGLVVTNTVEAREEELVDCNGNLCAAYNCIKAYATKYMEAISSGARNLSQLTSQNFQILIYCNLYNIAVNCQNPTAAKYWLTALATYMSDNNITGEDCGCGCGGSTSTSGSSEPTVIYPLYNSATYNSATETAKGIAELATQVETNVGTDDERIVTPLKLQKKFYDSSNTTSGTSSATLNKINGKITYSQIIGSEDFEDITLLNSLIVAGSLILWSIKYDPDGGSEIPLPGTYLTSTGQVVFRIYNSGSSDTVQPFDLMFIVVNP